MVNLSLEIEQFESNGEKTGWSYVFITQEVAEQLLPDNRREFRVCGLIDQVAVSGICVMPVKPDGFILPLKKSLRKQLRKERGQLVNLQLQHDKDFEIVMPADLEVCLADEEQWMERFMAQPKSHRNYFINWLNTAKTDVTRTKRLMMIVEAMDRGMDFGTMIRTAKVKKDRA